MHPAASVPHSSRSSRVRKRRQPRQLTPPHALVRRSPTLVIHWQGGTPIAQDYAIGVKRAIDAREFAILARLTAWTRPHDLATRIPGEEPEDVRGRLEALVEARLVEVSSDPAVPGRAAPVSWQGWAPEAAFFHFATKDGRRQNLEDATRQLYDTLAVEEYPDVLKRQPGKPLIALPPVDTSRVDTSRIDGAGAGAGASFPDVLRSRRTWRRFGDAPLAHADLSTLLGLTWGVQQWMRIGSEIRSALKTSPSGGACHSIEAYVVARRVDGLTPGIYHYNPDAHALARVRNRLPDDPIVTYLGGQPWYREANALFLMTSVIPRVQWKYRFPRAYRSVLLEAGHFCQTFCLVATWLGLAPFCTGLVADSLVERALRIDGVDETVIYAAGVGSRPGGPEDHGWAPLPAEQREPELEAPAWRTERTAEEKGR
jgi:SagB-type dehydrogenase family enzyme